MKTILWILAVIVFFVFVGNWLKNLVLDAPANFLDAFKKKFTDTTAGVGAAATGISNLVMDTASDASFAVARTADDRTRYNELRSAEADKQGLVGLERQSPEGFPTFEEWKAANDEKGVLQSTFDRFKAFIPGGGIGGAIGN